MYRTWTHQHVMYESRQLVTVSAVTDRMSYVRNYRHCVRHAQNCPYGPNCSFMHPKPIYFWPPLHPMHHVQLLFPPQFGPLRALPAPRIWASNDFMEFKTPSSVLPKQISTKIVPYSILLQMNRRWEPIRYGNHLVSYKTMRFTLLSYNVLCQSILDAHQPVYDSCRREDLIWEARWEKIYNEILSLDPDVFCLQEVQAAKIHYYAHFQSIGYLGIFKKKTRYRDDGCAVFYKSSKFEMIDKICIEFRCEDIPFLRADSVGIIVKLAPRASPNTRLVVANTHLLYSPYEATTRLAQMRILLSEIERFSYDQTRGFVPVILTGDFNALPHSNVIKFLEDGQICIPEMESLEHTGLYETSLDRNMIVEARPGANPSDAVVAASHYQRYKLAKHPFRMLSVYELDRGYRWATVDHIYFTNGISVVERLSPPTKNMRRKRPNELYGSDHISIAAIFEIVLE